VSRILIQFPGHGRGRLFDPEARDAVTEPFLHLRDRLRTLGRDLETADDRSLAGCEGILFWDFHDDLLEPSPLRRAARAAAALLRGAPPVIPARPLYADAARAGLLEKMVLMTAEPPVVLPRNWDGDVHALFRTVLTWRDDLVDGGRFRKFRWPIAARFPAIPAVPFDRKNLLVNVSGNKYSTHPLELYGARRATIRHFERRLPGRFDLYGTGWEPRPGDSEPYRSYRGTVRHKWDLYPRYRFGLCYENMREAPGFITEKIFDCLRADCVPIYWGASNITDYVDAGAFIDRRRFASDADLEEHLLGMSVAAYEEHRQAIHAYLAGPRFAAFLPPAFADTVVGALGLRPSGSQGPTDPR